MPRKNTYWNNITGAIRSTVSGMKITFMHLIRSRRSQPVLAISEEKYFAERDGIATIQYPHEMQPIPDAGRYRLHNEIDDCIVCDKCAKTDLCRKVRY